MTSKKRMFPPAFEDEGGVSVPHEPSAEEMTNCAFAQQANAECPRRGDGKINCGNCIHLNTVLKGMFAKTK